jgi:hypothetical protein
MRTLFASSSCFRLAPIVLFSAMSFGIPAVQAQNMASTDAASVTNYAEALEETTAPLEQGWGCPFRGPSSGPSRGDKNEGRTSPTPNSLNESPGWWWCFP